MAEVSLICSDCGGSISHLCGSNAPTDLAQSSAQNGQQARIEQGFDLQASSSAPKRERVYNQGYEPEFIEFWKVYPLLRGKRKAQMAWRKSVLRLTQTAGSNRSIAVAQILAGAIRYRDDPNRSDEYTKYAEGWLNGDGWEDEPLPARGGAKGPAMGSDAWAQQAAGRLGDA